MTPICLDHNISKKAGLRDPVPKDHNSFGVRQGSVFSPFLFAVYLDDLAKSCDRKGNVFIILYADDILLVAPSVCELDNV